MSYIYTIAQAAPTEGQPEAAQTGKKSVFPDETNNQVVQPENKPQGNTDTNKTEDGAGWGFIGWIAVFIFIMYFLIIRPQKKQQKELKDRQDGLKSGDKVVTAGGIFGIVREVKEQTVRLEIAPNTVIKVAKTSIVQTVAKDGTAPEVKK